MRRRCKGINGEGGTLTWFGTGPGSACLNGKSSNTSSSRYHDDRRPFGLSRRLTQQYFSSERQQSSSPLLLIQPRKPQQSEPIPSAFKLGDTFCFTDRHWRERIGTFTRVNAKICLLVLRWQAITGLTPLAAEGNRSSCNERSRRHACRKREPVLDQRSVS